MDFFANFTIFDSSNMLATSITDYFFQSNFAGQVIIIVLLILSVMAWGVMFCKYADLTTIEELNNKAAKRVATSQSLIDAAAAVKSIPSPNSRLLKESLNTLASMKSHASNTAMRTTMIENALYRVVSKETSKYEEKMTLLGTIISGAPFLGLLGTAWGVMDCFGSLGGQTSVTLQQLAPGVSGALLTTVAGLLVAIPSVFGYNFLSTKIKTMSTDVENFAGLLSDKIEIESMTTASQSVATREPKPVQFVEKSSISTADAERVINFSLEDDDTEEMSNFDER